MARCTASRAFSLTLGEPLMTLDTVPRPTPARAATASRVGRFMTPILPDDLRVPDSAVLEHAPLALEVHVHEAEALAVAPCPLEVIHKRPGEIALQRYPGVDRVAAGAAGVLAARPPTAPVQPGGAPRHL